MLLCKMILPTNMLTNIGLCMFFAIYLYYYLLVPIKSQ
jgi:hypothetical protein